MLKGKLQEMVNVKILLFRVVKSSLLGLKYDNFTLFLLSILL